MKRTYYGTMMIEDLTKATVELAIYENCKYEAKKYEEGPGKIYERTYTGLTSWDIIEGGSEAEEIEKYADPNSIDEKHEYLILHFEDGNTATFRNSHVDMFII